MGRVKMNLVELVKGSSSEEEADDRYPFCGHQKIDRCRKEWSIRKDSMASRHKSPMLLLMVMSPIIPSLECHIFGLFL